MTYVITYAKSYINKLSLQYFTRSLAEYLFFYLQSSASNILQKHVMLYTYISYLQIFPIGKKRP